MQVTTQNGPAAEVSLAANPRDPLNLVGGAKDFTLGPDERCGKYSVWSGVYWTRDGGRTWGNSLLPGHPKDARKTALSDYACGSDPVLAFGPEGNVYYASIHYTDAGPPPVPQLGPVLGGETKNSALAVTRSRDGGATWDEPVLLGHVEDGSLFDKEWIATDPASGQVYVTHILRGVLSVQRSDDHGEHWTEPVPIVAATGDGITSGPGAVQFGQVAVGPGGLVHFVYWGEREAGEVSGLYHKVSPDRGATWSAPHPIARFVPVLDLGVTHKYRIVPNEALAVDAKVGALYVAWPMPVEPAAAPRAQADHDIFVASSTDGGQAWSAPVRVNDDLVGPTNGQWMPALAVGPEGTLHATWLDYREDPVGQSAKVYYSFSRDGGKTWAANAPVSDVPFDGTGGYHQSGAGTIGDYMGLAVTPLAVHPSWADTRHGRNDVFAAIIPAGASR